MCRGDAETRNLNHSSKYYPSGSLFPTFINNIFLRSFVRRTMALFICKWFHRIKIDTKSIYYISGDVSIESISRSHRWRSLDRAWMRMSHELAENPITERIAILLPKIIETSWGRLTQRKEIRCNFVGKVPLCSLPIWYLALWWPRRQLPKLTSSRLANKNFRKGFLHKAISRVKNVCEISPLWCSQTAASFKYISRLLSISYRNNCWNIDL